MVKYEIGKHFIEGITRYPEGTKFDFTQAGPALILFFDSPTEQEISGVKSGRAEFGFYFRDNIIFFLCKFEGTPWMDAPYSIHLSKPFFFDQMTETQGFGLQIFLVDAGTGILKVMRLVGLSNDFSRGLREAVEKQRMQPFNRAEYDRTINTLYANYTTKDFVDRADARCKIR